MVTGFNHLTLCVTDLEKSIAFYQQCLGFCAHVKWHKGAYLSLNEFWLCLSVQQGHHQAGSSYTHYAFSVPAEHFQAKRDSLVEQGVTQWQQNSSEGASFYFLDPDGHKLELHVGSLESRLQSLQKQPYSGLEWLNPLNA